jgi:hypothetical protein
MLDDCLLSIDNLMNNAFLELDRIQQIDNPQRSLADSGMTVLRLFKHKIAVRFYAP